MSLRFLAAIGLVAVAPFGPSLASEGGGDREPAGGAFMSSYSRGPYAMDRRYEGIDRDVAPNRSLGGDVTGSVPGADPYRARRTRMR